MSVIIVPVDTDDLLRTACQLFAEYADELGVDLCFQNFQQELASLPGGYALPNGRLLLAVDGEQAVGCVAVRKLEIGICELKRLYVRPNYRSNGVGRMLVDSIIVEARKIGYTKMRLDSLTSLKEAARLYRTFGFVEIPAYCVNPLPEAVFMEMEL
jgi:GNAT superfamily N-acetyltransferase